MRTIKFKNFKSFGEKEQTFHLKKINLVFGPNSIGKSSLLELIARQNYFKRVGKMPAHDTDLLGDTLRHKPFSELVHKKDLTKEITFSESYDSELLGGYLPKDYQQALRYLAAHEDKDEDLLLTELSDDIEKLSFKYIHEKFYSTADLRYLKYAIFDSKRDDIEELIRLYLAREIAVNTSDIDPNDMATESDASEASSAIAKILATIGIGHFSASEITDFYLSRCDELGFKDISPSTIAAIESELYRTRFARAKEIVGELDQAEVREQLRSIWDNDYSQLDTRCFDEALKSIPSDRHSVWKMIFQNVPSKYYIDSQTSRLISSESQAENLLRWARILCASVLLNSRGGFRSCQSISSERRLFATSNLLEADDLIASASDDLKSDYEIINSVAGKFDWRTSQQLVGRVEDLPALTSIQLEHTVRPFSNDLSYRLLTALASIENRPVQMFGPLREIPPTTVGVASSLNEAKRVALSTRRDEPLGIGLVGSKLRRTKSTTKTVSRFSLVNHIGWRNTVRFALEYLSQNLIVREQLHRLLGRQITFGSVSSSASFWRRLVENQAGRNILDAWLTDADSKLSYSIQFESFKRRFSDKIAGYRLKFRDEMRNVDVSPTDLGLGISQSAPIVVALSTLERTDILIEQPELHLHPHMQCEMADVFIRSANIGSNTVVAETHSEHILLRLQRRIRQTLEGKAPAGLELNASDVNIIFVDYNGQSYVKELRLDTDGTLLDPWPRGFFEDGFRERFL